MALTILKIIAVMYLIAVISHVILNDKSIFRSNHILEYGLDEIEELIELKEHKTDIGFDSVVMVVPSYKKDFSSELFEWCDKNNIKYSRTHVMSYEKKSATSIAYMFKWSSTNNE